MSQTLFEMVEEMRSFAHSADREVTHARGDDILIEALRFMCERTLSEGTRPLWRADVEELIAAWKEMPKWYA